MHINIYLLTNILKEFEILGPQARLPESESQEWNPGICVLTSLPDDF